MNVDEVHRPFDLVFQRRVEVEIYCRVPLVCRAVLTELDSDIEVSGVRVWLYSGSEEYR